MPGQHFRAGVVAVVTRDDGLILAFERSESPGQWQLPQGGLLEGERPVDGAWRELSEETGLGVDDVRLVDEYPFWISYEWPEALRVRRGAELRIGQTQRWFFFRPLRKELPIVPDGDEFCDWRWVTREWLVAQVWDFRRVVYEQVLGARR